MEHYSGRIIHALSGFYYVEAAGAVFACKAKGAFRNRNITPLVGDLVELETDGENGVITAVGERKNYLRRPPVANIDRLFILSSVARPRPNLLIVDKLAAFAVRHDVEPVIATFSRDGFLDEAGLWPVMMMKQLREGGEQAIPFVARAHALWTGEGPIPEPVWVRAARETGILED